MQNPLEDREKIIERLIQSDPLRMNVLKAVSELGLPDWLIGAGFVRNLIWDYLHDKKELTFTDVDVAYFDPSDLSEEREKEYEQKLKSKIDLDWSVTNQARMGRINNQDRDYHSTQDAIAHWPETATALGVFLCSDNSVGVVAPYGLDDLFDLKIRMTPNFGDGRDFLLKRIQKKKWLELWPKLKVVD